MQMELLVVIMIITFYKNKNHYPLFNSYIKDISENKYQKEIITKINIDNMNRSIGKYPNPNNFTIPLNGNFTNITKFVISDLNFKNINQNETSKYQQYLK